MWSDSLSRRLEAERPKHTRRLARPAIFVLEAHAVDEERRPVVHDERAAGLPPGGQDGGGRLVSIETVGGLRKFEPHAVGLVLGLEHLPFRRGYDVVRRADDAGQIGGVGAVAQTDEGIEAGHADVVAELRWDVAPRTVIGAVRARTGACVSPDRRP